MFKKFQLAFLVMMLSYGALQAQSFQKTGNGIILRSKTQSSSIKTLSLNVVNDRVIQVISTSEDMPSNRESLIIPKQLKSTGQFEIQETDTELTLTTQKLICKANKSTLQVSFFDKEGSQLLKEGDKFAQAAHVKDESCHHIKQSFKYLNDEVLYGLGSYQDADMALNGKKITLLQKNRDDVVPVIVSTNRYGIIWDNYSLSEFSDTKDGYYLWSEVADEINYFFIYGDKIDDIISSYRELTGTPPMYPKWVYGYMQSKQKYDTQEEIVGIVKGFRDRQFPLDLIVQDWQYWNHGWGQKSFDRTRYPDPKKMVEDIHGMDAKIMISIWPNMAVGTPNQKKLETIDGLFENNSHLNILKPEAREMYWKQVKDSLFSVGIDAWWADCTEGYDSDWAVDFLIKYPDVAYHSILANEARDLMGSGRYVNAYALMHTKGLYEGQRATTSDKRVYILTRSSFAGMQKYGASYWTGDVSANWEEFRMQIPAGLNFCMTGVPYWTTDIAGYFVRKEADGWWFANGAFEKGQEDQGFHELYTRWFQFSSFCPLFRAHGAQFPREPWEFGGKESQTYQTLLKFTKLRYRLLPYIYSLSWQVTKNGYTMMRALPFDFMADKATHNINDQYMFGSAFLVNPVTRPLYYLPNNVKLNTEKYQRNVYLPKNTSWYDFWTGEKFEGGQTIKADASFETMPLFVKAGSIVPLGPNIQYSTEKADPIEIRIYAGEDGEFTLYEDENDNYNYEKGLYSLIKFTWDDQRNKLTIHNRIGEFPGMLGTHTFNIVLVNIKKGKGVEINEEMNKTVEYKGKQVIVEL